MADFSKIIGDSPYTSLHSCINDFPEHGLQDTLEDFRRQNPHVALSPLLYYCVQQGKLAPFEELLASGVSPDEDVVEAAALQEDESFLFKLLEHGWPINHTLQGGRVPSVLCLAIDRPALFDRLLKLGASPNAISTSGETPLSVAVQTGSLRTIRSLLQAGADAKLGDVLHYAVEREGDELEVIGLLLAEGAPVDGVQFSHPIARQLRLSLLRGTPLHKASLLGKSEVVKALLFHGANPNSTRVRGSQTELTTPFDIAKQRGDERTVALFEDRGPSSRI